MKKKSKKMDTTAYLLSSPANKKHLAEALQSTERIVFTPDEFQQLTDNLSEGRSIEGLGQKSDESKI
jgi:hypothetical protein